jgi:large subunit ribosomal protein L11
MSLVRFVFMRVPAGAAKPGPAIGQALGPLGINMAEFCKQFNDKSSTIYKKDVPLTVRLHAMSDRTFTFDIRTPPASWLIKQVCGIKKGPSTPNAETVTAYISPEAVYEIAKIKQTDDHMWHLPLEGIARSVIGTCKTLGVKVKEVGDEDSEEGTTETQTA